jgi:biopolymer transport protein ExbB/TolQ
MNWLEIFNIVSWICGILSFLISIFIANKVVNIDKSFNTNSDLSEMKNDLKKVKIKWNYTGRDNNK